MDRGIVYPGAIPLDLDNIAPQRAAMIALGGLAQAVLGNGIVVDGLACTPTTPSSMSVSVGPGIITALTTVDPNSYGSLGVDNDPLLKIGQNTNSTHLTLAAPGTFGQTINYLIEAEFLEVDGSPVVLPYYNAANPAVPYSGPANAATPQNTSRMQRVSLQVKAGASAVTGLQANPAVDSGWVGLWIISVSYGATAVSVGNISPYPGAPFIATKLPAFMGNNVAIYEWIAGAQQISVNGAAWTTVGASAFQPPPNGTALYEVIGGGGSGGSNPSVSVRGGGGGAGGRAWGIATGLTGPTMITIGAGGASVSGVTTGNNGGSSSFGAIASATGGQGAASGGGGMSGAGSGGYTNESLGDGEDGNSYGGSGGGPGGGRGGDTNGLDGRAAGAGGGGAMGGYSSGAGFSGRVVVRY